jgi:hypothetical protein
MGFGLVITFIRYLQIVATNNYSVIANPDNLQIITFSACCVFSSRCLVTASNAADPLDSVFAFSLAVAYLVAGLELSSLRNLGTNSIENTLPNNFNVASHGYCSNRIEIVIFLMLFTAIT